MSDDEDIRGLRGVAYYMRERDKAETENARLRTELAAERERSVVQQSSFDMLCKEVDEAEARIAKLRGVLKFFSSVIKSGEPWTNTCERAYRAVLEETKGGGDG